MGNSHSSDFEAHVRAKLDGMEEKLDGMEKKLAKLDGKVGQIDNRYAALVERAYRSRYRDCEYKEIVTAEDAVSLISTLESTTAEDIVNQRERLVKHLYRYETRKLLSLICPEAGIDDTAPEWEKSAYAALKAWLDENGEMKESDDHNETAQWTVVKKFTALLKPFDSSTIPNGAKTSLDKQAITTLLKDRSGLTLSLILAHENVQRGIEGDKSKCWAWRVLVIDGYETGTDRYQGAIVTAIRTGGRRAFSTAKKQLKLRARFLGAVASCIGAEKIPSVFLVAAILKSRDEDHRTNQADSKENLTSPEYGMIEELTLKKEYFRL